MKRTNTEHWRPMSIPHTQSEHASGRPIPDLSSQEIREEFSPTAIEAMVNLAKIWRLTGAQVSSLLGEVPETEWFQIRDEGKMVVFSHEVLTRVSALVGVYKGLHLLFSEPLANEWVRRQNANETFSGLSPLDYMQKYGIEAMLATRSYIDALRGGL